MLNSSNWVTVARLQNQQEYLLARARLEASGIECFSPNEHMARLAGPMIRTWNGHEFLLQVRPEDEEDAKALLADPGSPFLVSE
jgi:Putative prokaryotic signal transducing protein